MGLISALALFWDWWTGGRLSWSVDFVIPLLLTGAMIAMAVIARVMRLKIQDYILYLMLDANGAFSACSMRADFSVTVLDPGFNYFTYLIDEDAADLTIEMSGMFSITSDDADIVYPSDLAEYPEIDLSDLLPGILG